MAITDLSTAKVFLSTEVAQELAYLRGVRDAAVEEYNTIRGWIGRNSWYLIPAIIAVSWSIGHFWR